MVGGYNGRILRVNLTNESISVETIDERLCRKYLGGAGFIYYFLSRELKPGIDPLSPANKLIFATGPVTGISLSGAGRHCVGAKSPLTGTIAKAEAGEFWGAELKAAGFDAIIVEGRSEKPVYLWLHDGEASIKNASHLWGQPTRETQQAIRSELGDNRVRVALIGPGGENLVKYACIMHGLFDAAARGGVGAVMGSKNLKAIAVRGSKPPTVADSEGIKKLRQWMITNMSLISGLHEVGTGFVMDRSEVTGNLPVRNFRDGVFPGVKQIDALAIKNSVRTGMEGCYACAVRCKKIVKFEEPYSVDSAYGGPEYESLAALGSNCGIDDLKAICKANELCNAYSLDTISTGSTIAFAMECFERGLLTLKDTGGIELKFGNHEAMLKVIELIARRQGIGNFLAEGTARAARKIGRGAEAFALQVKGLETGMHEPRLRPGLGLAYMVNPHGADHCCAIHDTSHVSDKGITEFKPLGITEPLPAEEIGPRKVNLLRLGQLKEIVLDCLGLCFILPYSFEQVAEITGSVTGWHTGVMEQLRVAERILTTARLFNVREGFTTNDDKLPERFFQPKTDGALSNTALDPAKMEAAKRYYYSLMGWDVEGVPTPQKLDELEIA